MLSFWSALVGWVVDVQVLACGLLSATVPLAMLLRQPARRLAVLRPTLVGLAALGVLSAVPGWSLIHLRTEPPALAVVALPAPPPTAELAPPPGPPLALRANSPQFAPPAQAAMTDLAPTAHFGVARDRLPGWASLVAGAFALGSLGVLLWQTAGGWQTRSIVRRASPAPAELIKLLESMVAPAVAPRLLISREIAVAAAVGVRRPTVLIPRAMLGDDGEAPTDPRDLAAVLAHEWAHVHNGDLRTLAASRWLLALAWPQPLFWLLRRLVRLDQETLADAAAADRTSRTDYAERLVAWARRAATAPGSPRLAAAAGLWERPSQLKRRVSLLLDEQFAVLRECSRRWRLSWRVAAAIGAIGLSTMTLEPGAAENAVYQVGRNDADASNSTADLGASSLSPSPYMGVGIAERDDASVSGGSVQEAGEMNSTDDVQEVPTSTAELADPLQAVASDFYHASRREPNVVAGLCIDDAGRPVAGVEVSLYLYSATVGGVDEGPSQRIAAATTGADGRYRFERVIDAATVYPDGVPPEHLQTPPIKLTAMLARKPGRATAWDSQAAVEILNQGHLRVTTMRPAATLRGRIVDQAGRPIAGAGVTTNRFLRIPGVSLAAATTDDQGRFEIQEIEPYDQEAERKKFADWVATLRAQLPPDDFQRLESTQAGEIYLPVQPGGGPQFQPLQVYVSHPRYVPAVATVARVPGEVEATLSPGGTITGRVVRPGAAGDEPAAGCVVYVQPKPKPPAAGLGSAAAVARIELVPLSVNTTDVAGIYRVDSLAAGEYVVAVDGGDDWVAAGLDGIVVKAGVSTAAPDVRLSKGGIVRVQLVDADTGEPLTFAKPRQGWLHATARDGRVLPLTNGVVEFTSAGVGRRRLAPGRYFVFAALPSDGPTPWPQLTSIVAGQPIDEQPTIDVVEGQTHEIELRMRREEISQAAIGALTPTLDLHSGDPPNDGSK
ncbi:MAG: hypothetical protein KF688_02535 [Pirellulales bacterium]|nr:hypothetical protein [Pirellulales bacterium]